MTCIVGLVHKETKKVIMGADSAGVADSFISIRKDTKIFRNGEFIIGCTSSFRMIQLLQFSFKPVLNEKEIFEYMCTDFIEGVRNCFKDGGFMQKGKQGEDLGGQFLVGFKDRLFNVNEDFQVEETLNGIDAIGCGCEFALGALHVCDANLLPEERVLKALRTAELFSTGVRGPFNICSTYSSEINQII